MSADGVRGVQARTVVRESPGDPPTIARRVIPIVAGFAAAFLWAGSTLASSWASRRFGARSTVSWVMLSGLAVAVPFVLVAPGAGVPSGSTLAWLGVAGSGNVAGLFLVYTAFASGGQVAIVATLAATQGAIAALLAIAFGERLGSVTLSGLVVVTIGVLVVAGAGRRGTSKTGRRRARTAALGMSAALVFGLSLFAAGRASDSAAAAWVALPARAVGVAVVLAALGMGIRPAWSPPGVAAASVAGCAEVGGIVAFAIGAREGIAITSVVASQFAALAAVGAFVLFRERLARRQVVGILVVTVGVALLALGSA